MHKLATQAQLRGTTAVEKWLQENMFSRGLDMASALMKIIEFHVDYMGGCKAGADLQLALSYELHNYITKRCAAAWLRYIVENTPCLAGCPS